MLVRTLDLFNSMVIVGRATQWIRKCLVSLSRVIAFRLIFGDAFAVHVSGYYVFDLSVFAKICIQYC